MIGGLISYVAWLADWKKLNWKQLSNSLKLQYSSCEN